MSYDQLQATQTRYSCKLSRAMDLQTTVGALGDYGCERRGGDYDRLVETRLSKLLRLGRKHQCDRYSQHTADSGSGNE